MGTPSGRYSTRTITPTIQHEWSTHALKCFFTSSHGCLGEIKKIGRQWSKLVCLFTQYTRIVRNVAVPSQWRRPSARVPRAPPSWRRPNRTGTVVEQGTWRHMGSRGAEIAERIWPTRLSSAAIYTNPFIKRLPTGRPRYFSHHVEPSALG